MPCAISLVVQVANPTSHHMLDCVTYVDCWPDVDLLTNVESLTLRGLVDHILTYCRMLTCWPYVELLRPTSCTDVSYMTTCIEFTFMLLYRSQYDLCDEWLTRMSFENQIVCHGHSSCTCAYGWSVDQVWIQYNVSVIVVIKLSNQWWRLM